MTYLHTFQSPLFKRFNLKFLFSFLFFTALYFTASTQNCGVVQAFTGTIVDNGNGTSTYNFAVTLGATSGGVKSTELTIICSTDPSNPFVDKACRASSTDDALVYNFGPFTRTTCTGTIQLIWTGQTNSQCGGTTCQGATLIPLPVELVMFETSRHNDMVLLEWVTGSEINNEKFLIERSTDGVDFRYIGEVEGNGDSREKKYYKFMDEKPESGVNYYRLKQMDFDGNFEYSPLKAVSMRKIAEMYIYPTIVQDDLQVALPEDAHTTTQVSIYDMKGALIYRKNAEGIGHVSVSLPSMPTGQYMVEAINGKTLERTLIIKQ